MNDVRRSLWGHAGAVETVFSDFESNVEKVAEKSKVAEEFTEKVVLGGGKAQSFIAEEIVNAVGASGVGVGVKPSGHDIHRDRHHSSGSSADSHGEHSRHEKSHSKSNSKQVSKGVQSSTGLGKDETEDNHRERAKNQSELVKHSAESHSKSTEADLGNEEKGISTVAKFAALRKRVDEGLITATWNMADWEKKITRSDVDVDKEGAFKDYLQFCDVFFTQEDDPHKGGVPAGDSFYKVQKKTVGVYANKATTTLAGKPFDMLTTRDQSGNPGKLLCQPLYVKRKEDKILACSYHARHPKTRKLKEAELKFLQRLIESKRHEYRRVVIGGDFNELGWSMQKHQSMQLPYASSGPCPTVSYKIKRGESFFRNFKTGANTNDWIYATGEGLGSVHGHYIQDSYGSDHRIVVLMDI